MTPPNEHAAPLILIAEDSATQAELLKHLIEDEGYRVIATANGREAWEAARRCRPSLILSDVVMPEMDGYSLCKAVKADPDLKDVPFMLVTMLADALDVLKGLECGADNFIRKPYERKYLLSRIEYLLTNNALRSTRKVHLGVEIDLRGQRHFITAERQQIFDLLLSTYEQAVQVNAELQHHQQELTRSNQVLEGLYRIAKGLNASVSEAQTAAAALDQAASLPSVCGGWLMLHEPAGGFRVLATRNLPPNLRAADALEGDCECRRRFMGGELRQPANMHECECMHRARDDACGLRHHLSVPLWAGDRNLGVMNLIGAGEGGFDDQVLHLFNGIGNQIGIALDRARMHAHMEALVEERTAELRAEMERRRETEEAQARLLRIIDATSDFVGTMDREGCMLYCNDAMRRLLDLAPDQDISHLHVRDFHPEWAALTVIDEGIPVAVHAGRWSGETAMRTAGGQELSVSQLVVAHKALDGRVEFISTIARDISERKAAEIRLRQSERRFRSVVEATPDVLFVLDADGRFMTIFGGRELPYLRAEDILGRTVGEVTQDPVANLLQQVIARVLESGALQELEHSIRIRGETRWFSARVVPLEWDEKPCVLWVSRDITEKMRAELTLAHREQQLRLITDALPALITYRDRDGRVIFANRTAEDWFARPRSEIIGFTARELMGARDYEKTGPLIAKVLTGEEGFFEGKLAFPDGRERIVESTYLPHIDNAGRVIGFITLCHDVTERREVEQRLSQIQRLEAIGNLTGGVAHDFNNRLTVILGNLQLLQRRCQNDERIIKLIAAAIAAGKGGAQLTKRLLAFARRQALEPEIVDVNKLVRSVRELLSQTLGEAIAIETALAEDLWPIKVDPGQLEDAVLNLATNARDAMPQGGRLIIATANVRLDDHKAAQYRYIKPGDHVMLTITDTGTGMSAEVRDHAFDPFFTTKPTGKGTGLGLSMVYGFVKQSNGYVHLYSEEGHGTCVKIYLPRYTAGGAAVVHVSPSAADVPHGRGERILVVEDDPGVRAVAVAMLIDLGYQVIEATDGPQALEVFPHQPVDLLFTDIIMPGGMTGIDLARTLLEAHPSLKILLASGYMEYAGTAEDRQLQGVTMVNKPYQYNDLATKVRQVLRGRRGEEGT